MINVKALKPHGNEFGKKYHKETGDEYLHPAPQPLIDNKLVEIVSDTTADGEASTGSDAEVTETGDGEKNGKGRGAARTGADASKSTEGNGTEHA